MDRIDVFTALSGDKSYENFVTNMDDDGGVVSGTFLSGYIKSLARDKVLNEKQIRNYSLLYAALDKQKLSLQRFIIPSNNIFAFKYQIDLLIRYCKTLELKTFLFSSKKT